MSSANIYNESRNCVMHVELSLVSLLRNAPWNAHSWLY